MFTFRNFIFSLLEEKRQGAKQSDDEGKMFEILSGYHLNGQNHMSHYREEGKTPKNIHDEIKDRIGEEAYNRINNHASNMAQKIHDHLHSMGYKGKIRKVVWTSQKSDIKHFTGKDDPNNESDVMVEYHHAPGSTKNGIEHVGYSMKYANNAVTLKNNTPATISHTYGVNSESMLSHHNEHMKRVHALLGTSSDTPGNKMHEKYKEVRNSSVGAEIQKSSNESRRKMIEDFHNQLKDLHPHELHDRVLSHLAGETQSPVFMAHSSTSGKQNVLNNRDHYAKMLALHKDHLKINKGSGTSVTITGRNGVKLFSIEAASKGRPTKTPEYMAKPGAAMAG